MNKEVYKFTIFVSDHDNDIGDTSYVFEKIIKADYFHIALKKFIELCDEQGIWIDERTFKFKTITEYKNLIEI